MYVYYTMCAVLGCWEVYETQHQHTECPKCGVSRAEIIMFRSNELDVINKKKFDKDIDDLYNDSLGG